MAALEEGKKITHIPTILKEAEKALEKLEGTEEYPVMKELFEALGTSFRKRAYGYNLNELYTVSEMLKSKKITADDLTEGLKNFPKAVQLVLKHQNNFVVKEPEIINVTVGLDGTEDISEMYAKAMYATEQELNKRAEWEKTLINKVRKIMQEEAGVFYEDDHTLSLSVHTLAGDPDIIFFKDSKSIMIDFTSDIAMYSDEDILRYHFEIIKKIDEAKKSI